MHDPLMPQQGIDLALQLAVTLAAAHVTGDIDLIQRIAAALQQLLQLIAMQIHVAGDDHAPAHLCQRFDDGLHIRIGKADPVFHLQFTLNACRPFDAKPFFDHPIDVLDAHLSRFAVLATFHFDVMADLSVVGDVELLPDQPEHIQR